MREYLIDEEFNAFMAENYGTEDPTEQAYIEAEDWLDGIIENLKTNAVKN